MLGVKPRVIEPFATGERMDGSVKNCRVPISANTRIRTSADATSGTLIRNATCHALAPSILAASYSVGSMPRSAA